ncbi:NAD-dependent protein deacylase Sirt4-like isoform X2 [Leptopilina boulardi]|uniref:NAD-dependent protein deacylase Sirt4-like isoform X2 n=1 Tax=Leptopilina boulardi TaxID=63433 RepID=UPI0021F635AD|nr:NAD-dependent protein deacylase Sirt4-like isoform X2 [Leptopilina boulardi]
MIRVTKALILNSNSLSEEEIKQLKKYLDSCGRLCVLTGAGISTESGIPDYRSEDVGLFATSNKKPVSYQEFCRSDKVRRRYWSRNYVGWPRFSKFAPNVSHKLLKHLEDIGQISCVITQNVDNLHKKAGSQNVIELHGTAFRVMCLNCDHTISRYSFQEFLDKLNPNFISTDTKIRPDGDVELSQEQVDEFNIPPCSNCQGILKPDIVFFGDNVTREVVQQVKNEVKVADSLLVLGTSLNTFSGYRIILQAVDAKKPIAIVSIGETRGDNHANIKIQGRCGEVLSKIYGNRQKNNWRITTKYDEKHYAESFIGYSKTLYVSLFETSSV